jgi:hypothetical protein
MALIAICEVLGTRVNIGERVTSFRGETAVLKAVTRARIPGKSGKVVVQWDSDIATALSRGEDVKDVAQCEYYDKVFDLEVRDI